MDESFGPDAATFLLRGGEILDPGGAGRARADVFVENGRIRAVGESPRVPEGTPIVDVRGCFVSPGFVDMHVHLREPGQEEKETIATGTLAAAAGGFTTVACMPNTSPPIDNQSTLEFVLKKALVAGHARVLPIAAITREQKGEAITEMAELAEMGAIGFSDDGFPVTSSGLLRRAMEYARALDRPIISHAEDLSLSDGGVMNEGALSVRMGLKGIPAESEELGVVRDILLSLRTGCRLHICHVSTAGAVDAIRRAKARGVPVTGEAAPHHFTLTEESVIGYRTAAKMNPPLRTGEDVEAVIAGLVDGTLDAIATDHAPHTAEEKEAEFDRAPFGIVGLETAIGLTVSELVEPGHLTLEGAVEKLSEAPRRILGLDAAAVEVDRRADLTVWNPSARWVVSPEEMLSRSCNTPFLGRTLVGRSVLTVADGKVTHWRESLAPLSRA
jgi:dihydroorotase